ncbi:CBS domain-containing protein [Mycoplana ramosa]|uniref:CBS domain-containing protein n=1 Tax=Mycoplana ramosa TaxID=40837 RepID=A0ABW3YX21_MYCRA
MKAKDIMTSRVISITPDHSVGDAARIMLANRISGLPVCDSEHRLVGMLTEGDLLQRAELSPSFWFGRDQPTAAPPTDDYVKRHSWRVSDVMSRHVVTVNETTPTDRIAAIMVANDVNRVPVMRGETVVGIVSRQDLLRAVASYAPDETATGDRALRRAILERLCEDVSLERELIDVAVTDGQAFLWGQVTDEAKREAAGAAAASVAGVKGVTNRLRVVAGELPSPMRLPVLIEATQQ